MTSAGQAGPPVSVAGATEVSTAGATAGATAGSTRFDPAQRRSVVGMAAFVALLHIVGWGVLALVVAPRGYAVGNGEVLGLGLGLVAYTLGMRHAFDADHIAAIDNTTRKLMADGTRPVTVGFWFSLGHSSVVFGLCLLLAFGVRAVARQVQDSGSTLQNVAGVIGTSVSGVFLLVIGLLNLVVLIGVVTVFVRLRRGEFDEAALERQLASRGVLNRLLRPVTRAVRKPWHMYPVGFLFGLGFDTATEVSLLVLAGGAAAFALPWYAVLVLPVVFAAGMSLLDAADGAFMNKAYGWAFAKPVRKVYYNMTITALSVVVALVIGGQEVVSVIAARAGITSGPIAWIGGIDLGHLGFAVVGLFVLIWVVAVVAWKYGRIEERWSRKLRTGP